MIFLLRALYRSEMVPRFKDFYGLSITAGKKSNTINF